MEDVAPKLADELLSAYKKAISKVIKKYEKYIKEGSIDYETAHNFSLEAYDIAFNAVKKTLTPAALPDEKLYFNIAERTLKPLIEQGCNDIADYCKQIQKNMNDSLGAHIKAADVPLEADRIDDIVSHAANIEKFDEVVDKIGYSMENLYQHVVDESIRRNADMHYKLGFKPKIIRIAESKCCEWCSNLEGTYNYADVSNQGNDVFRRHRNCRCKVLYEEKKGDKYEVTNVHTKKSNSLEIDVKNKIKNYNKVIEDKSKAKRQSQGYLNLGNSTNTQKYFDKNGNAEWINSLSFNQIDIIKRYTSSYYTNINNFNRKIGDWENFEEIMKSIEKYKDQFDSIQPLQRMEGELMGQFAKRKRLALNDPVRKAKADWERIQALTKDSEDLSKAINKFNLKDDIKVYRTVNSKAFDNFDGLKVGDIYKDESFMSTSPTLDSGYAKKDIIMELYIPAGAGRGAYLENLTSVKGEYEFLLEKGSQFDIKSIEKQGDKTWIKMEMIKK